MNEYYNPYKRMQGYNFTYNTIYPYYYYPTNMISTGTYNHNQINPDMLRDFGPRPYVVNLEELTRQNDNFRTTVWTGDFMQLTLMSIPAGESIGLEMHGELDQFIRIEDGQGLVMMGSAIDRLDFQREVFRDYAIIIPAGTWHNLINTGNTPIKLYSIYAPPQHPFGTIHKTKQDAEMSE